MAQKYTYHQTISHEGLHKEKTICGNSRRELEYKASLQFAQWDEQWAKKETYYTEAQTKKKYDNAIYQIALVLLKYGFCLNKYGDLIDAVVVNGIINTIDKTTGNDITAYVLSVRTDRIQFENLNLRALDPRAWFRSAKGVAAASIATVTPVQPVQTLNKEDHRFVEGYEVLEGGR